MTAKKKILIVDDNVSIVEIYSIALAAEHFSVITAVDGQEGLEKALKEMPDLILLDVMMPVMDGFEMLQKLRGKNDYGKKVAVIFLTNMSAGKEDIIEKIVKTEPLYYIIKSSLTPTDVVKKVKERLEVVK